jgi:hypothetical protein
MSALGWELPLGVIFSKGGFAQSVYFAKLCFLRRSGPCATNGSLGPETWVIITSLDCIPFETALKVLELPTQPNAAEMSV